MKLIVSAPLAALALAGCAAVGPDFRPPTVAPAAYVPDIADTALPTQTAAVEGLAGSAGQAQRFVKDLDVPALWWGLFHSAPLDELIRSAIEHSPTLAAAQATLRQAQQTYLAQSGNLRLPQVDAKLGAQRERAPATATGTAGGQLLTLYNASVNVSYSLDVFGGVRRQLEGAQAAVDAQRFQVEAVYLTLTGNLVTTAIREASLRAQLDATGQLLAAQRQQLDMLDKQFELGAIARSVLLAQQTQVAQTVTLLAPLQKSLAQTRNQLAVYAGRWPGQAHLPEFDLASLNLPSELPLSLPSELARQRPDVRASEALLHQASAQIGVATANLYPQIQLSASFGSSATGADKLFGSGWTFWNLLGGLTQPLFHGQALHAQQRADIAAFDAAAARYRSTLLTAFQNVADALRALQFDAEALKAQAEAQSIARQSLQLTTQQHQLGAVNSLQLLIAQQAVLQTRIALVQVEAARYADTAALFQALGGGWWNRGELGNATLTQE